MIGKTGIYVIGNDEVGYFATWGKYRVSEKREKWEEVEQLVLDRDYEVIMAMVGAIADAMWVERTEEKEKGMKIVKHQEDLPENLHM